jgi:hypothetical protein
MSTPTFLPYTITSTARENVKPSIIIGASFTPHPNATYLHPANPQNDSYWIVFLNAKNPREKVKEWVVPGQNNSTVPGGIDTYINDPDYIFAVVTQYLNTINVPQGDFYNFLAKYGAGRELQKLEQLYATLGYGTFGRVGYILTGPCGPRSPVPPASYEVASYTSSTVYSAMLMMSLESMPNGGPPYGISDNYTWK